MEEVSFKSVYKELLERGKKKGFLNRNEINAALEELSLDVDKIEKTFDSLESSGIEIVDDFDKEISSIAEEEIDLSLPDGATVDDHVRMYHYLYKYSLTCRF